ncbi:hypothetical protein AGDE_02900 [Angomonas deanei]|nr:hypothetical protein AGDE_02900 [Angomonas deanei]|eukprot:EPY41025.1 hypothetical protein AGDE_02900 [Angomonas deanei]
MYAVKPWGNVFFIGCSVGSYAMGIGMRWRESNVTIVERNANPSYELERTRRCVITEQSIKLLSDLGCTESKLRKILSPAKGWRFLSPTLEVLREGATFPGCAVGEPAYHCTEGSLLRALRTEYMRFGGSLSWGTTAHDAFENTDGTDTWCLRKEYGMSSDAEVILSTASQTSLNKLLFAEDPDRMAVVFNVREGVAGVTPEDRSRLVGDGCDTFIMVGQGVALHGWFFKEDKCSWRMITKGNEEEHEENPLDDRVKKLVSSAKESYKWPLPVTTPAILDSAFHRKVSVLGDGLLPVDPFEWRGDNARVMIEEASTVCRAFYGKKYHRGNVSFLLREIEQDSLSKRSNLLRRDVMDAEHFLAVRPLLEEEPSFDRRAQIKN